MQCQKELSWFYLAIINIQLEKNTNQFKGARALKEPEGCRVEKKKVVVDNHQVCLI